MPAHPPRRDARAARRHGHSPGDTKHGFPELRSRSGSPTASSSPRWRTAVRGKWVASRQPSRSALCFVIPAQAGMTGQGAYHRSLRDTPVSVFPGQHCTLTQTQASHGRTEHGGSEPKDSARTSRTGRIPKAAAICTLSRHPGASGGGFNGSVTGGRELEGQSAGVAGSRRRATRDRRGIEPSPWNWCTGRRSTGGHCTS